MRGNFGNYNIPCSVSGGKVIGAGVQIYILYICIYIYMFVDRKKYLNRTLAIDSPFQTFAVGLLVKFID